MANRNSVSVRSESNGAEITDRADTLHSPKWVRARALAGRWGCSTSQVHRLCAKHNIQKCILGGTGRDGLAARNAMVLYLAADIEALETRCTM